jgi:hypothetical protein
MNYGCTPMNADKNILDTNPSRLSHLLVRADAPTQTWSPTDVAPILRHQLRTPLSPELAPFATGGATQLTDLIASAPPPLHTFHDLLHHPSPPLALLTLLRDFAKSCRADGSLPDEIATLLYYASLALARSKHRQRITDLDDPSLRKGLDWSLRRPWLDPQTRSIFESALSSLDPVEPR